MSARVEVRVGGRTLALSNLEKVLWPATGFTKAQLIDYYARVADVMLPHLAGRPLTLRRWPDGVEGGSFFEKNCPSHRPSWVQTLQMGDVAYCCVDEPAALVWVANLAAIELHPSLARAPDLDAPTAVVFDLDPGEPAGLLECAQVARWLRELLADLGLSAWPKTSGNKGLQVYVPVGGARYEQTKAFSLELAEQLAARHPDAVLTSMARARRRGKVFVDWSQNTASKTTVAVYSLRARDEPSVSTPVTWEELERALDRGDPTGLRFTPDEVLARIERDGDLHRPVLDGPQQLPAA